MTKWASSGRRRKPSRKQGRRSSRSSRTNSADPELSGGLAESLFRLKRYDEAIAVWQRLVVPGQARFQRELAGAYRDKSVLIGVRQETGLLSKVLVDSRDARQAQPGRPYRAPRPGRHPRRNRLIRALDGPPRAGSAALSKSHRAPRESLRPGATRLADGPVPVGGDRALPHDWKKKVAWTSTGIGTGGESNSAR